MLVPGCGEKGVEQQGGVGGKKVPVAGRREPPGVRRAAACVRVCACGKSALAWRGAQVGAVEVVGGAAGMEPAGAPRQTGRQCRQAGARAVKSCPAKSFSRGRPVC